MRFGYPSGWEQCVVYEGQQRCPYRWMEEVPFKDRQEPGLLRVCAWHAGRLREAMS